ncbi:MAG: hypothetical protein F6K17_32245 [Okeania sp. SIO3C4]|nr:hypothetical protein [Okeania sp. SIO3B3]NER06922.1 hypothetical protein [Okeania sp. SIO3C4]
MKAQHIRNFTALSAALLASSAYLCAPQSASATTLIRGDDGAVEQILDLEVNGEFFDVEFVVDSYDNIYNGTFDFDTLSTATVAAEAVVEALGVSEFTRSFSGDSFFDFFLIPFQFSSSPGLVDLVIDNFRLVEDTLSTSFAVRNLPGAGAGQPYAKFTAAAPPGVSTPEPTLILGFITLSGLMLGSKRKTKG